MENKQTIITLTRLEKNKLINKTSYVNYGDQKLEKKKKLKHIIYLFY